MDNVDIENRTALTRLLADAEKRIAEWTAIADATDDDGFRQAALHVVELARRDRAYFSDKVMAFEPTEC